MIKKHCGIRNPGTTCWLASCVHVLASIPRLRRGVYDLDVTEGPERTARDTFIEELQLVFHRLHNSASSISVKDLINAGRLLYSNHFRNNVHEDANEHFFKILEVFENVPGADDVLWSFHIETTETAGVRRTFNAVLSTKSESFYDALKELWYPNIWLKTLPEVLTFTINRSGHHKRKRQSPFRVLGEIALDRHYAPNRDRAEELFESDDPCRGFYESREEWDKERYTLTAVVMHKGDRTDVGHYFVYVLESGSTFILYDDEVVSKKHFDEIQERWSGLAAGESNASACLLIYTKNSVLEKEAEVGKQMDEEYLYSASMRKAVAGMKTRDDRERLEMIRANYARQTKGVRSMRLLARRQNTPNGAAPPNLSIQKQSSPLPSAAAPPVAGPNNRKRSAGSDPPMMPPSKMTVVEEEHAQSCPTSPYAQPDSVTLLKSTQRAIEDEFDSESKRYDASRGLLMRPDSSNAVSEDARNRAIISFFDEYLQDDYEEIYPEPFGNQFCKEKSTTYARLVRGVYSIERLSKNERDNEKSTRVQQLSTLTSSVNVVMPEHLRKGLLVDYEWELKNAIIEVIDWLFALRERNCRTYWCSNALFFSLYLDGDLSVGAAIRAIVETAKVKTPLRAAFITPLMECRPASMLRCDYMYHRFDLFLLAAKEYSDLISHWCYIFPSKNEFEIRARETEPIMDKLHERQVYTWFVRKLLTIFGCIHQLIGSADASRVRACFHINEAVLGRISAIIYTLVVLRLLHASRQMVRNLRVETEAEQLEDEAEAACLLVDLNFVRSILRALLKLSVYLSWWQKKTGVNEDIEHARDTMEGAMQRTAGNLGVTLDVGKETLPKAEVPDDKWREAAIETVRSLKDGTFAAMEKKFYVSMGNFNSLIETIAACEANTQFGVAEKQFLDGD